LEGKQKKPYLDIDLSFDKRILFIGLLIIFTISLVGSGDIAKIIGGGSGGVQFQTPPTMGKSQTYVGQLEIEIHHRDALDYGEARSEGTNLVTTYYKQLDDGKFITLGSGDVSIFSVYNDRSIYFTIVLVANFFLLIFILVFLFFTLLVDGLRFLGTFFLLLVGFLLAN